MNHRQKPIEPIESIEKAFPCPMVRDKITFDDLSIGLKIGIVITYAYFILFVLGLLISLPAAFG